MNCFENSVAFSVQTSQPITGRIFVKGHVRLEVFNERNRRTQILRRTIPPAKCVIWAIRCTQSHSLCPLVNAACNVYVRYNRSFRSLFSVQFSQLSPRGINFAITVIVSFHPTFITANDRAYKLQCFYVEPESNVQVDLEVR